jgi:putative DNA primase/helicase
MTTDGTTSSRRQRHSAPGFDSAGSVAGDDETQGADWKNEGYDFTPDPDGDPEVDEGETFPMTDVGNAERMAALYGSEVRWCERQSRWLTWDGARWLPDADRHIDAYAVATARSISADNPGDSKTEKFALGCESNKRITDMLTRAKGLKELRVTPEQLDVDPMLLNVANGTLDLNTGVLRPHDPADYLTKLIAAKFDSAAQAPRWMELLERVLPDARVREYLQRYVGYALTGRTDEESLLVLHGSGANGKSVIVKVLLALFADYGQTVPKETLLQKQFSNIPTDIARMLGKRLLVCMETEDGRQFDEAMLKQLVSGDKVAARKLREDFFEFTPTGKIVLATNHLPQMRNQDEGIWRRIKVVPFTVTIPLEQQDKALSRRIIDEELAGVLAWAVAGVLEWQQAGMQEPAVVRDYGNEYRKRSDLIGEWLDQETEAADAVVTTGELYASYKQWCEECGLKAMSVQSLSTKLVERGFIKSLDSHRRSQFTGLRLTDRDDLHPADDPDDPDDV